MAHDHNEQCETLQKALSDARARQSPPQRDTAATGAQHVIGLDPGDTTPDASPELEQQIANLEQELRDMGCEPR